MIIIENVRICSRLHNFFSELIVIKSRNVFGLHFEELKFVDYFQCFSMNIKKSMKNTTTVSHFWNTSFVTLPFLSYSKLAHCIRRFFVLCLRTGRR